MCACVLGNVSELMHFLIIVIMGDHLLNSKVSTLLHFLALLLFEQSLFVFGSSFSYLSMEPDKHTNTTHMIWQNTPGEVRCSITEVVELAKWLGKICHPSHPPPPVLIGGGERRESPILCQPCCCNRKQRSWLTWYDVENNWHTRLMDSVMDYS